MDKEAALLRPGPVCWGQGDGLCATCRLRGMCKHGLRCKKPPTLHQQAKGNLEVLDLTQRTEGTRKHSHAHRWALEEKPPAAVVPAGKLDPIGLGTGPLARLQRCPLLFARPQADLGLPSSRHGPGPSRAPAAAHQLFL